MADQYSNLVPGVNVSFGDDDVGGLFPNGNLAFTGNSGAAAEFYILPDFSGPVTISASVATAGAPAWFVETAQ